MTHRGDEKGNARGGHSNPQHCERCIQRDCPLRQVAFDAGKYGGFLGTSPCTDYLNLSHDVTYCVCDQCGKPNVKGRMVPWQDKLFCTEYCAVAYKTKQWTKDPDNFNGA